MQRSPGVKFGKILARQGFTGHNSMLLRPNKNKGG
jgi:hypothetical protein